MTAEQYYIIDNSANRKGPFTKEELKKMRLHPETTVLVAGGGTWQYVKNIHGIKTKRSSIAPESILRFMFVALIALVITLYFALSSNL